jgi:hypothetical protein
MMGIDEFMNNIIDNLILFGHEPNKTNFNRDLYLIIVALVNKQYPSTKEYEQIRTDRIDQLFKDQKTRIMNMVKSVKNIRPNIDLSEYKSLMKEAGEFTDRYQIIKKASSAGVDTESLREVWTNSNMSSEWLEGYLKSVSSFDQAKQDGFTYKKWVWTPNDNTRHESNNDQVVAIDDPFEIVNDKTDEVSMLMYPRDPDGDPGNTIVCYCEVEYLNDDEAAPYLETQGVMMKKQEPNINNTIILDSERLWGSRIVKLSSGELYNTYTSLKNHLPIRIELGHLDLLGEEKNYYNSLGYTEVGSIRGVEFINESDDDDNGTDYSAIRITDSIITKPEVQELYLNGELKAVSVNAMVNEDEAGTIIDILSISLVEEPACANCRIQGFSRDKQLITFKNNLEGESYMVEGNNESTVLTEEKLIEILSKFSNEIVEAVTKSIEQKEESDDPEGENSEGVAAGLNIDPEAFKAEMKLELKAEDLVTNLIKEGKVLPKESENHLVMAKADYEAYKNVMDSAKPKIEIGEKLPKGSDKATAEFSRTSLYKHLNEGVEGHGD